MRILQMSAGEGNYLVEATVVFCGDDINVCICGGTHYHLGAVALGIPRPSLKDPAKLSASVSVITAVGHKEDEVVREAAQRLATAFACRASVCAGLHIDNATKEEIDLLWKNFIQVLNETESQIIKAKGN